MPDFVTNPILNSPYDTPEEHWLLDDKGAPSGAKASGRRISRYFIPIPATRRRRQIQQGELALETGETQQDNLKVNGIRGEVEKWRQLPPEKWKKSV